jgi:hypothetical protein
MSWLTEDPTALVAAGVLIEALLVVALVKSGRGVLFAVMAAVLVVVLAGVLFERSVVTPREEVEATLEDARRAVERNDVESVLSHVDPAASALRGAVRQWLPRIQVQEAAIRDLRITVNEHTNPPTATAEFIGRVNGNFHETGYDHTTVLRHFTVDFHKQGDHWLMTQYQDREPFGRNDRRQ